MSSKIERLMHFLYLQESSLFKEVVALNEYDMDFLTRIGIFFYENQNLDLLPSLIEDAELNSPLYDVLKRHSKKYIKEFDWIYWLEDEEKLKNQEKNDEQRLIIGSINKNIILHQYKTSPSHLLPVKTKILEKFICCYIPLIEDFLFYYIKNNKEGLKRIAMLHYVLGALTEKRKDKLVIYKLDNLQIVDVLSKKTL
ncbi:MAG: hypothetical protein NZZ41_04015 [Candidatus Dojkabacteria bacterium]|nr:hypothetical protein [Candidatus Dojkabacteria bacterium]